MTSDKQSFPVWYHLCGWCGHEHELEQDIYLAGDNKIVCGYLCPKCGEEFLSIYDECLSYDFSDNDYYDHEEYYDDDHEIYKRFKY